MSNVSKGEFWSQSRPLVTGESRQVTLHSGAGLSGLAAPRWHIRQVTLFAAEVRRDTFRRVPGRH